MRNETIATNYAEALLALAVKTDAVDAFGGYVAALGDAVAQNVVLRRFLAAPQVALERKRAVVTAALGDQLPRPFVLFVQKVVANRRQLLFPEIAVAYAALVDQREGRVHATVTVARPPAEGDAEALSARLSAALGKAVVAHLAVDPAILGGVVVRIGDSVMDGSVRRRLATLKTALAGPGR
jgi:F-type H+-transporting ATPase subunit delta